MDELLPIESIRERDVDLILLEELSCNDSFCTWLVKQTSLPEFKKLIGVWRSISDFGLGETDLLMAYSSIAQKTVYVLIENKLDASFQQNQDIRYKERAIEYVREGSCDESYCVLVAPENYCRNQNAFHSVLTYEKVCQWFSEKNDLRSTFKANLIKIGIEKLRRGYQPVNSEIVKSFWNNYWEFVNVNYPQFYMKEPGVVPFNSDWPVLFDKKIREMTFVHKWNQGHVDLIINSTSKLLENQIKSNLPEDFFFIRHKSSFSIRKVVAPIYRTQPFEGQLTQIHEGLKEITALHSWFRDASIENGFNQ